MHHINPTKRPLQFVAALAMAVVLAACGSSGGGSSQGTPSGNVGTVSTKQVDGVGTVLVDSKGLALYSPDQEEGGKVLCTGACASFWIPLSASSATAPSGVADLGTITRPDWTMQVTASGRPLYTFSEDSPGDVKGNGFSDDFGGQRLTWHAVLANGTAAGSGGNNGTGGGGPAYGGY